MMFHGENRGVHVHKPKYIMQSTLAILAFLAVATGFIIEGPLHNFMYGVDDGYALIRHFYAVPFFSAVGAVVVGVGLGYLLYGKGQTEVAFITNTKVLLALRTFVAEGFYMDHLYNLIVIKPVFFVGEKLSFLHTGKINWNLMLSTLVTIVTIVLLMVVF